MKSYKNFLLLTENYVAYNTLQYYTDTYDLVFKFTSVGTKILDKAIIFQHIENNTFNLALVTIDTNGDINDTENSNNGDMSKIFSTIYECMLKFLKNNPKVIFNITSGDNKRMRVYCYFMNRYYDTITKNFNIFGELSDKTQVEYIKGDNFLKLRLENKNYNNMKKINEYFNGEEIPKITLKDPHNVLGRKLENAKASQKYIQKYIINDRIICRFKGESFEEYELRVLKLRKEFEDNTNN